ncbi:MAG: orotidine-5'-phosphate decarboxylase [Alteromonadaceae bacterium]|nr:MAG: orotidine-5'-phosphate decarboxylase [Alteromonadaceae bacterium]
MPSDDTSLIIALDYDDRSTCMAMVKQLSPKSCRLKVGKELFTLFGPSIVEDLQALGFDVFLDLKFHDIPNTVAKAVAAAASMGVWMVNVHASGGQRMLEAANNALQAFQQSPLLIAVTVLTSMDQQDLAGIGIECEARTQVLRLAQMTKQAGLAGVVCSAWEVAELKQAMGAEFQCVTPGIRLAAKLNAASSQDDQRRIMTPEQAKREGSDFLVVGRPVTQAADPGAVAESIHLSLQSLL